jgi:hypothetical protein
MVTRKRKSRQLSVRVSTDTAGRLDAVAERQSVPGRELSRADVIRTAIAWWLARVSQMVTFAMALFGCALKPADRYSVYLDPNLGESTSEVVAALGEWEQASGVAFEVVQGVVSAPDKHQILIRGATLDEISICGDRAVGCTDRHVATDSSEVLLSVYDRLTPVQLHTETLHEIGHALGLRHDAAGTVMCGTIVCGADHVTATDVTQYENVRK